MVLPLVAMACSVGEGGNPFGTGEMTLGPGPIDNMTSGGEVTGSEDGVSMTSGGEATGMESASGETETAVTQTGETGTEIPSSCGDGTIDDGEECDDGPANADDGACKTDCTLQACGDGSIGPQEACDDGAANALDAACLPDCTAASCGDGHVHAGVEVCDDGVNDGSYDGCAPGCAALAPHCGDGIVQAQEHCDTALPQPYPQVTCSSECLFDFSAVPQLYCNGTCSWAGATGCDQADADILCRLRTGNAGSTATSFQLVTALAQHGFSCASYGTNLGTMPAFGVAQNVWYQSTSVLDNYGSGQVVANPTCTEP